MRYLCLLLLVVCAPVRAAEVGPCNDLDRVSFLVGQTKSLSQGKIRIAEIDTDGEPVCCSEHLLIFIPSQEIGSQCFAVSQTAAKDDQSARGFNSVVFDKIATSYDAAKGLLLTVPYTLYNDGKAGHPGSVNVRVNLRGEGSVKVER